MASSYGVSFMPGGQDNGQQNGNGRQGSGSQDPVQEAVKVLSLRLRKGYGNRGIAPAPLLHSPGGMGQPGTQGNVTAQALAMLAGLPAGGGMPPTPAPMVPPAGGGGGVVTLPSRGQDSQRGVSRTQPVPYNPAPAPAPSVQTIRNSQAPRVIPGQNTGDGPYQSMPLPAPWVDPRPTLPTRPPEPAQASPSQALLNWLMSRDHDPYGGFTGGM